MFLKRIELKGFKSFPNKTDIEFNEGITSIVGPNGSGKSNISDAIRWVLGEQNIRNLRGDKLEDVIFSGSETKNKMNYCEVCITIDNLDKQIDLEFSEINIKRRVYRSGESEFFINNKSCRLKDVKEMFLDTGIGKDGYSIIEQGKVEEILSNNPQNRRKVFDEACKISKFRYKKTESERNLRNTKENLERINDIYIEIKNKIEPLEIQQRSAKKYLDLSEKLKTIEVNKYLNQIDEIKNEFNKVKFQKENIEKEINQIKINKDELEVLENMKIEEIHKLELEINRLSKDLELINSFINQKSSSILVIEEKVRNITNNIDKDSKEFNSYVDDKVIKSDNLEGLSDKIEKIKISIKNLTSKKEEVGLNKKIEEINNKKDEIQKLEENILEILDKKREIVSNKSVFNANLQNINQRQLIIESEKSEITLNIKNKNNDLNLISINNLEDITNEINNKKQTLENNLKYLNKDILHKNKELTNKKYLLNEQTSKIKIYSDMQNHYEGFNRGVREVLKSKSLSGILGAFAEIISTKEIYEKAIESSSGSYMQNIISVDENSAKIAIKYLKDNNLGRVTFLPINVIKSNKIKIETINSKVEFKILSDLVNYDPKYKNIVENILGRIILIDNIDNAIKFANETNHRFKIVTLDGEILNPGGSLTGGSLRSNTSILSRKRVLDELLESKNTTNFEVCEIEKNLENINSKKLDLENEIKNYDTELISKEKDILLNTLKIDNIKGEILNLEKEYLKLDSEKNHLGTNLENINLNLSKSDFEYNNFESKLQILNNKINLLKNNLEKLNYNFENDKKSLEEINLILAKETQILENKEYEKEKLIIECENVSLKIENFEKEKVKNFEEIKDLEKKKYFEKNELDKQKSLIEEKNLLINKNKDIIIKFKLELNTYKEKLVNINRNYFEQKEELYKINSRNERTQNSINFYTNELLEKYELNILEANKLKVCDFIFDKETFDNLRRQIKSLGNINLDSIKDYEEVKERYDFYSEQKLDLEGAILVIEKLIVDLEKNMKKEFITNFENINDKFKEVYKRLFGGGYGELVIVDKENILSSDIEIIAKPPGKETKNLNLLSGGEKALTAISILFAILLTKPTPFCILDEIEAPLDDMNISRFGEFLKELSNKTQFIAVTHRRGTMNASDFIYGVTMQEKGISSVISLRLEEADKITDIR